MFTWICPKCGAEVPPAYSECPNCQPVAAAPPPAPPPAPAPARTAPAAPPPPAAYPTRVASAPPTPTAPARPTAPPPPPPPPVYAAPEQPAPPQQVQYVYVKPAVPAWLVTLGVFAALLAAGYAFYSLVLNKNGSTTTAASSSGSVPAAKADDAASPAESKAAARLEHHLEVAGVRIVEENKKPQIRMMVVNHSSADMAGLKGSVTLTAEGKPGDIAVVPFTLAALAAYEAKEVTAPLKTSLRAYELPDWQFMRAKVKLVSAE